jgi:GNAT superfamily N-acetyltransferase
MSRIIKRKVNESEARLLVRHIKSTPNIVGYTFDEWLNNEHTFIAEDELGQLLGACLNYDINPKWTKIAALYVLEEFRSKGIGKALFYESVNDATNRGKNVYTISCNSIVLNIMSELEFTTFTNLIEFPSAYIDDRLGFYIHTLEWLSSAYRIKEIIRKQFVCRPQQPFVYGLKSRSFLVARSTLFTS